MNSSLMKREFCSRLVFNLRLKRFYLSSVKPGLSAVPNCMLRLLNDFQWISWKMQQKHDLWSFLTLNKNNVLLQMYFTKKRWPLSWSENHVISSAREWGLFVPTKNIFVLVYQIPTQITNTLIYLTLVRQHWKSGLENVQF